MKVTEEDKLVTLGEVPPMKSPSGSTSKDVYASIHDGIDQWIKEAITIRNSY